MSSPLIVGHIEHRPMAQLKTYPNNTAVMSETSPAITDAIGLADIVAGHARLRAARQLGMTKVPFIVLAHLSEAQRRALVTADNQLALNAAWGETLLRAELAALQAEELTRLLAEQDHWQSLGTLQQPCHPAIGILVRIGWERAARKKECVLLPGDSR